MICFAYFFVFLIPVINFDDRILEQVTPEEFWLLAHIAKRLSSDMTCFPSNAKLLQDNDNDLIKIDIQGNYQRWKETIRNYQIVLYNKIYWIK